MKTYTRKEITQGLSILICDTDANDCAVRGIEDFGIWIPDSAYQHYETPDGRLEAVPLDRALRQKIQERVNIFLSLLFSNPSLIQMTLNMEEDLG